MIFKSPYIGRDYMDAAKYKQMSGRAGRTGFDSKGDSIMICTKPEQYSHVQELVKPFKCDLQSVLTGSRLMRSILEIIASGSIQNLFQLSSFVKQTLKFVLCNNQVCTNCFKVAEDNDVLFSQPDGSDSQKRVFDQYELFLNKFELEKFRQSF